MDNDWRPSASIDTLKRRAQLLADVRLFFAQKKVLEVDTPILSLAAPTAPYLDSFTTDFVPLGTSQKQTYYLQTSPEFAMKRLLAAGSGSIYQIAKVFRNGEHGRVHCPEFTMLEWYRLELSLEALMDEVAALLSSVFSISSHRRLSYQQAFKQFLNIDVLACSDEVIKHIVKREISHLSTTIELDRDGNLALLMSEVIEPKLATLADAVFIYHFPPSQAQLAKIKLDDNGQTVAARFELYVQGVELANGYDELRDADELRLRFEQDNVQRQQLHKQQMPIDNKLLAAMQSGLPQCTGVALGLERILMLTLEKNCIADVQSLDWC